MPRLDKKLRGRIRIWYRRNGRSLPWRGIRQPYRILLSEVMLQQTQVDRVLEKYPRFLRRFPSLRSLAAADLRDVIIAWRGMGYNNRAVRLHRLAQTVLREHAGRFPHTLEGMLALPGIGPYTARAVLSGAFRQRYPIVDVNVSRLFSRLFWRMRSLAQTRHDREIWALAEKVLPTQNVYEWNQALMDLGARVCTARQPGCEHCPLRSFCASKGHMLGKSVRKSTREQQMRGIPNRLFRGRIVEFLRSRRDAVPLRSIGRSILPGFSDRHGPWLTKIVAGLERDGVVRARGTGAWRRYSLP
jgi:A/G-specific adenine glycosylase